MSRKQLQHGDSVGVSTPTLIVPEPEFLTRDDIDYGRWDIRGCEAVAGIPSTEVASRSMFAPLYDDELSRHMRAHEMFHAKVSPTAKQMETIWRKRNLAKDKALIVCEELRVNTLLQVAGFKPEQYLKGGSERFDGENISKHGDFNNAVLCAVAYRRTAGWQDFLDGVKIHKPEWVQVLEVFTKQACCYLDEIVVKATKFSGIPKLHATGSKANENGFGYTEHLAQWIQTVLDASQQDTFGQPSKGLTAEQIKSLEKSLDGLGTRDRDQQDGWRGAIPKKGIDNLWGELRVSKPMLDKSVMGAIGRKKIASQTGKNPRRISRLLSDPERRIFDRTVKGAGGVVLIDTSGSMSLSADQVKEMVSNAPSALVAMYSGGVRQPKPNLWLIANKGRMCSKMPTPNGGNEIDGEALRWAIKQRQRTNSPIIWVSDGCVTGKHDRTNDDLVMDCIKLCKQYGIYVVPDARSAIVLLKRVKARQKITSDIPSHLADTYKELTGQVLILR